MKTFALALCTFLALGASALAQTNLLTPPATPPVFPTNQLAQAAGFSAVTTFALNLLPAWDQSATNSFNAGELTLEASPVWKAATASGSTPYLSLGGDYYFARHFGAGADLVTFGNGTGSSDLDSAHGFLLARADQGNVAGHALLGGGRDINRKAFDVEAGFGLEYRYSTRVGILVDTRYLKFFDRGGFRQDDHEWLTRVGITVTLGGKKS